MPSQTRNSRPIAWLGLLAMLPLACHSSPAPAYRPNVIVFLVDDLGWQDVGVPFGPARTPANDRYQTPSLQRLCNEGTRCTDAYAHTVCTPSRVSLLTGVAAARHGVTHWTLKQGERTDRQPPDLRPPRWNWNGLQPAAGVPDSFVLPPARTLPDRALFWHHPHLWGADGPGIEPYSAVRLGAHKLLWFHRDGRCELYDVVADLGERNDLLAAEPELAARLRGLVRSHLEGAGAALPLRADGTPIPLP